jgi:hypothetical protein
MNESRSPQSSQSTQNFNHGSKYVLKRVRGVRL